MSALLEHNPEHNAYTGCEIYRKLIKVSNPFHLAFQAQKLNEMETKLNGLTAQICPMS